VTTPDDDEIRGSARPGSCAACGAAFASDQRYCLECGARHGSLPPAIASRLSALLRREGSAKRPREEKREAAPKRSPDTGVMPSPRAAAAAVMGMLALGVLLGSATSQIAQSAGIRSILLEVPPPAPPEPVTAVGATAPSAALTRPLPAAISSIPVAEAPVAEEPSAEEPAGEEPVLQPELEEETLPPVKHVFLIVLGENSYEETFGVSSPAPYLAKTLAEKGELLTNYYAVTKGDLANQVALLSGQGPTAETAANCPNYTDVVPGTVSLAGQVEGSGCVYPAETATLPGQLAEKKLKWKAYVEDIGNGAPIGQPATCRHPALGGPDPSQVPVPGDAFVTWRNPFVYFHSLLDSPECGQNDVSLDQLAPDLKDPKKTPALSYIVPSACHDGGELPCEVAQPPGPVAAEAFLQRVVPTIEASSAYKEGGLIAITSAQARQTGPTPDTSSCCVSPAYPNLPAEAAPEVAAGPVKPTAGGGRVGLLLLSPFVAPGARNETAYFNHYSLLLSIEELFELERIGYASEVALTPFDSTIYNYETSSSSASCRDCASRVPSADQSSPSSSKNPWRALFDLKATR
jgi:phosphatidylinositol-3-phosphatase